MKVNRIDQQTRGGGGAGSNGFCEVCKQGSNGESVTGGVTSAPVNEEGSIRERQRQRH